MTFLTLFLPLVFVGYAFCCLPVFAKRCPNGRWKLANGFLLAVSLLFYAWGEGSQTWILVASCLGNFLLAGLMVWRVAAPGAGNGKLGLVGVEQLQPGGPRTTGQKILLVAAIIFNLGILSYFKYANFFMDNITQLFPLGGTATGWVRVALPLGVSFFTFHSMSYVIDVYRGDVRPSRNLLNFSCYSTMFPQLVAGPIVRYRDISSQLTERSLSRAQFASGVRRFIVGLSKKVLIANTVAVIADKAFALPPSELTVFMAWLGIVCYTLQIYYDFSGYSDMAIGLGRMFGFEFLENFNYPYSACSVRDFWRRWHISLSTWFRDYLYRPLGGDRKGPWRTYLNLGIVFFLCGLWHGASWMFVAWGLYHGFFLICERLGAQVFGKNSHPPKRGQWLGHIYVLSMVMGGWVLFRSATPAQAWGYFLALFGICEGSGGANAIRWLYFAWDVKLAMVVGSLFSAPVLPFLSRRWMVWLSQREAEGKRGSDWITVWMDMGQILVLLGLLLLCFLPLASGTYNPFIYFRF